MKKLLPVLVMIFVIAVSACGGHKDSEEHHTADTAVSVVPPRMSTPEAQAFVDEYERYVNEFLQASEAGDTAKVNAMIPENDKWEKKIEQFIAGLSTDDANRWGQYLKQKRALMKKAYR